MKRILGLLLASLLGVSAFAQADRQILVKFTGDQGTLNQQALQLGHTVVETIPNLKVYVVQLAEGEDRNKAIITYQKMPQVVFAEINGIYRSQLVPNDPFYNQQWALPAVSAPTAWDTMMGSAAVTIAIVDTGVSLNHPDLASRIVAGYDFVNNDAVADDDNNHGTHCAGIAAAIMNNNTGIAGLGAGCNIMPVKVLSSGGSGSWDNVAAGIDWASANGAKVVSLSLGGSGGSATVQAAVDLAWSRGSLVVCAAGNNGTTGIFYPAGYTNSLAVASTDPGDGRSSFSTYGAWVEVAAPGSNIYSTLPNNSYGNLSGTSMACPLVAGLAGLLFVQEGPFATNVSVRRRIEATSDKVGSFVSFGRINAAKALRWWRGVRVGL
ncbi:MAG TPA: S8 family peptidase [Fimbriimonadaceae bacterium]|nr:S8 family peptidase [Fimbriimonadaceae bacterium]HRJ32202.1 S8 family peptidase [Fimbriimonadaceae bacterium]